MKMKTQRSQFAHAMFAAFMAITFSAPLSGACQETAIRPHSTAALTLPSDLFLPVNEMKRLPGTSLWGEINSGYSNYGMAGEATINYRWGNRFVSAGYYKSHLCYHGYYDGLLFPEAGGCVNHITVTSYSFSSGIILPGRLYPSISCGVSISQMSYQYTSPIRNDFSLSSFWGIASGNDYDDGILSSRTKIVVGVPVAFRIHLATRHTLGYDAGIKADINAEKVFIAAQLGIRIGKVAKSRNH
jgi:hypothetical protein